MRSEQLDYASKSVLLSRFLSALSWAERGGIASVLTGGGGSHLPTSVLRLDRNRMYGITERFAFDALPEPDDRRCLALTLMREGRSLNSKPYAFLTFYRVLELTIEGKHRGAWIDDAIPKIRSWAAAEGLRKVSNSGVRDIGKHLRESGRMAIAHASYPPIIDPDDLIQCARFHAELPVMEALAEIAVIEQLGVAAPR